LEGICLEKGIPYVFTVDDANGDTVELSYTFENCKMIAASMRTIPDPDFNAFGNIDVRIGKTGSEGTRHSTEL
jgi:hypothetical protein